MLSDHGVHAIGADQKLSIELLSGSCLGCDTVVRPGDSNARESESDHLLAELRRERSLEAAAIDVIGQRAKPPADRAQPMSVSFLPDAA